MSHHGVERWQLEAELAGLVLLGETNDGEGVVRHDAVEHGGVRIEEEGGEVGLSVCPYTCECDSHVVVWVAVPFQLDVPVSQRVVVERDSYHLLVVSICLPNVWNDGQNGEDI